MAQKWTAESNTSGNPILGFTDASIQLSDGTHVWIDGDPSTGHHNLCYSSDHATRNVIVQLDAHFYTGATGTGPGIALCRDSSDNLYVVAGDDASDDFMAVQAFTKGAGYTWTAQTILFTGDISLGGANIEAVAAVWCNTGGGTNAKGHLMCVFNDTNGYNSYLICNAGAALAGSGTIAVNSGNSPAFFGSTSSSTYGGNLTISAAGFGATSGLAAAAFTTTLVTVGSWAVNSSGALSTNTNLAQPGSGPMAGSGASLTKIVLLYYASNRWALIYNSGDGELRLGIYSSTVGDMTHLEHGLPTNWPTNLATGVSWDAFADPQKSNQIWLLAWSTASATTLLGLSCSLAGDTISWASSVTVQDTLVGSGGTNSTLRIVKQPLGPGIVVDYETSNLTSGTYVELGSYYNPLPIQVVGIM